MVGFYIVTYGYFYDGLTFMEDFVDRLEAYGGVAGYVGVTCVHATLFVSFGGATFDRLGTNLFWTRFIYV